MKKSQVIVSAILLIGVIMICYSVCVYAGNSSSSANSKEAFLIGKVDAEWISQATIYANRLDGSPYSCFEAYELKDLVKKTENAIYSYNSNNGFSIDELRRIHRVFENAYHVQMRG